MWEDDNRNAKQTEPLLKKGTPLQHDPNFRGVKEEGRKFNDILFGLLFTVMCVAMVAISSFAFSKGDPKTLIPSWEFADQDITADAEQKGQLWFQDAVAQLKTDSGVIGASFGLAIVLAAIWIQLLKMFTKLFIYLTMALGLLLVIAVGVYVFTVGVKDGNSSVRIAAYCIFALAGFLILGIIFLRKRIALTCELFKECCLGVQWNPAIFLVVGIVIAIYVAFNAFWVSSFVYLYSIPDGTTVALPHAPPKFNTSVRNLMYFQTFGYFWITSFLSAVFQVSVAGAIATWYFSRDLEGFQRNVGSPALRSFGRAWTKSLGSLALGSLIIAIVKFINLILKLVKQKNKATQNVIVTYIIRCVQCLFACIEKIISFINKFAYIYIAMHGDSFCGSARNVFELLSRNMFDAVFVDALGEFVLFIGKLFGTAACTLLMMGITHGMHRPLTGLTTSIVVIISYVTFHIFSKIIATGVDTVFVCYLEDVERNKDGALYVSTELHSLLQSKLHGEEANNGSSARKLPQN